MFVKLYILTFIVGFDDVTYSPDRYSFSCYGESQVKIFQPITRRQYHLGFELWLARALLSVINFRSLGFLELNPGPELELLPYFNFGAHHFQFTVLRIRGSLTIGKMTRVIKVVLR